MKGYSSGKPKSTPFYQGRYPGQLAVTFSGDLVSLALRTVTLLHKANPAICAKDQALLIAYMTSSFFVKFSDKNVNRILYNIFDKRWRVL